MCCEVLHTTACEFRSYLLQHSKVARDCDSSRVEGGDERFGALAATVAGSASAAEHLSRRGAAAAPQYRDEKSAPSAAAQAL